MTTNAPIGVLCALPEEQELLIAELGDPPPPPGRALEARRGLLDGRDVIVAAAGVGKVSAAVTAARAPVNSQAPAPAQDAAAEPVAPEKAPQATQTEATSQPGACGKPVACDWRDCETCPQNPASQRGR